MKIYIVLWQDRHTDTTAHPFRNFEKAKEWAKKKALEACHLPEDLNEEQISGWLYFVNYNCEGDCLWITEHKV